jgi:hypothetical protein
MNIGDLGKKAQDFLNSAEGERRSDDVLDKVADFADDRTGGKHAEQIRKGRDAADDHLGTEDSHDRRR